MLEANRKFKPGPDYIRSIEKHFGLNIVLVSGIANSSSTNTLNVTLTKFRTKKIETINWSFTRKPHCWKHLLIIWNGEKLSYLRIGTREFIETLPKQHVKADLSLEVRFEMKN